MMRPTGAALIAAMLIVLLSCGDGTGPGGRPEIVFASLRSGNWEIHTVDADGREARRLTSNRAEDLQPSISPDRSRIAFVSWRQPAGIYLMNANGRNQRLVYPITAPVLADHLTWSPDGTRLAFHQGRRIYVLDVESGSAQPILRDAGGPSWSPDGEKIAVHGLQGGIFTYTLGDETIDQLLPYGYEPDWSPDGNWIAFSSIHEGTFRIYVVSADLRVMAKLSEASAGTDRNPDWSPGGNRLAFVREIDDQADIMLVNRDGTGQAHVTDHRATDAGASW